MRLKSSRNGSVLGVAFRRDFTMPDMTYREFEELVADIGLAPVPERFRDRLANVAILVEDDVSEETRLRMGLAPDETLLGLYQGVPHTERGSEYGFVLPDTITIYRLPTLEEADETGLSVRKVIEETIWHEVAHHFGLDEDQVASRTPKHP